MLVRVVRLARVGVGPRAFLSTDTPDRAVGQSVDLFSAPGECEQYSHQNSRARRVVALSH